MFKMSSKKVFFLNVLIDIIISIIHILPFRMLHFKCSLGIGLGVVLNEMFRLFGNGDEDF